MKDRKLTHWRKNCLDNQWRHQLLDPSILVVLPRATTRATTRALARVLAGGARGEAKDVAAAKAYI